MDDFKKKAESIYGDIIILLDKGVKERKHPFHTPVFSNNTNGSFVDSRVVVLRKFDKNNLILNFHTDLRSPKVSELKKNNNSSLLFYDSEIKIQLRIKTRSKINYQNKITRDAWEITNLSSRKCYLTQVSPSSKSSTPTDGIPAHLKGVDPSQIESEIGYNNFVVIQNQILNIDWLYLSSKGHRRLKIIFDEYSPNFEWLIP